jgi:DNA-binding LytR/AlgR family response regulator
MWLKNLDCANYHRLPLLTAYRERAVRAFDVHAVDYLTEPADGEAWTNRLIK